MDKIIRNVLKKLENNGFEAYIVGGYVRDLLVGNISYDIDICTNALPKDLYKIFHTNITSNGYGGVNFKLKKYNIDITTYREEIKYENRKPIEIKYINNLIKDLERRDLTINSICMNYHGKIIDLIGGVDDINNRTIRMIGDIDKKLEEDPLRILRAIRFSAILDFEIEKELSNKLKEKIDLLKTLSDIRIKNELNKILISRNYKKGLLLLEEYNILKLLKISYEDITYVNDINGMWAQLNYKKDFAFTNQEKENIMKIREVLRYGKLDNKIMYKSGLYISQIAGNILGIPKNKINNRFSKLGLTNKDELNIKADEIVKILGIDYKLVSSVVNKLIDLILEEKVKNTKRDLKNYLIHHRKDFIDE